MKVPDNRITFRCLVLGAFFAAVFAVLTVYLENRGRICLTANQMPVLPYAFLLLTVVLVNPLCRLVRFVRVFTRTEILIVFVMGLVSSGLSTFGLTSQLVPVIGSFFNQHWNNEQSEWNLYVEPFLKEHYFISEPGIQRAAREYRSASLRTRELVRTYNAAVMYAQMAERGEGTRQDILRALPGPQRDMLQLEGVPPVAAIIETYPSLIEAQNELESEKRAALSELEAGAFEKVDLFRRGLPRGLRAFPGIFPIAEQDDAGSYFRRLGRLVCGKRAARDINKALRLLKSASGSEGLDHATVQGTAGFLGRAVDALSPAGMTGTLEERKKASGEHDAKLTLEMIELGAEGARLNEEKRQADGGEARRIRAHIDEIRKRKERIEAEKAKIALDQERNAGELDAAKRVTAVAEDIQSLRDRLLRGDPMTATDLRERLAAVLLRFGSFDGTLRRYFLGDIPWSHWVGPLAHWGVIIGLTYVVLMTFNVLIFRQWAYNEKLIYPLAQLPAILAGEGDDDDSVVPRVFRSALFWVGVGVSGAVMGWNLLCMTEILPNLKALDLKNSWTPYLENTALAGLVGTRSELFFTMVGLAFLIPKKVSFSLWFFWIFFMVQLQVMVWLGYGQDARSFPAHWWYTLNFRTAQGAGGLLVFSGLVLFKCRKYLLCAFTPASVSSLPDDEQKELRLSSLLFIAGTLGIVLMLWLGMGVNLFFAVFCYVVIMMITIGLVRSVTEGGVLGFQAIGPFHYIRHIFGFDKSWASPSFAAPLLTYYSILFLDIKTFIAPAMANSLKIRDDLRIARGKFHFAIFLCLVVAAVVAIVTAVMMSYSSGADSMRRWFYVSFPLSVFDRVADMVKTPPTATTGGRLWLGFGALFMGSLLFLRQRLFWLPHPIGYIMLVNPIMAKYWFSILLGWIAKSAITKYGNRDTYIRARGLFIGLIVGELVVVMLAMVLSIIMGKHLMIDLNR